MLIGAGAPHSRSDVVSELGLQGTTEYALDALLAAPHQASRLGLPTSDAYICTSLSGSIFTILAVLSWICVGIHMYLALSSPICA